MYLNVSYFLYILFLAVDGFITGNIITVKLCLLWLQGVCVCVHP